MGEHASKGPQSVRLDEYVIRLPEHNRLELRRRAERLGAVEDIPAYPDLLLLHLAAAPAEDAKSAWKSVQGELGEHVEVNPIVVDEDGRRKYPLGSIVVRFPETPSDEELQTWAREHELVVQERNKYVPQQVSFRVAQHDRRFLPEVLEHLLKTPQLRCWLDTLSSYRR